MKLLDSSKTSRTVKGFTIIEIMVVMVIAGVILSIILFSVPALQRNSRNTRRDQDAAQIAAAINDCMTSNQLTLSRCNERSEIVFDDSKLTAFTGFHYGENPDGTQNPPDFWFYEANWLFKLRCNADHTSFDITDSSTTFVVTYFREKGDGSPKSRCIEG